MKQYSITIYASKSARKNAKTDFHTFRIWDDGKTSKKEFTNSDIEYLKTWIETEKDNFPVFHVVAYADNVPVTTWQQTAFSDFQAMRTTETVMKLFNVYVNK